jgi:hypothetical protein
MSTPSTEAEFVYPEDDYVAGAQASSLQELAKTILVQCEDLVENARKFREECFSFKPLI